MKLISILFAILFGVLSLAPNMQGGQFLKFNELVEHYEKHQEGNKPFSSFFSFVKNHYFSNSTSSEDENNMPFKSTVVTITVLAHIHSEISIPRIQDPFESIESPLLYGEPSDKIVAVSLNIWNPPKMA
jgi:hypothetical protein